MEIEEPTQIPEPEETGSSGAQLTGHGAVALVAKHSPLEGLPIAEALVGLAATRSRSIGGEVAACLISGSIAQLSYDLQTTRGELHNVREELKRTHEELSVFKTKAAVLQERVSAHSRGRYLKNMIITAGTAMISIGIELYRNNFDKFGFVVGGLGVALLALGWFSKTEETER